MQNETTIHSERSPLAVIANITEQNYLAHRMYGTFQIAARPPAGEAGAEGEGYALTRITSRTAAMDYGDKRTLPLHITAREIAEDICREINSDAGERSYLGVFVCAGEAPTTEELRAAKDQLDEFYRALVAAADREWDARTRFSSFTLCSGGRLRSSALKKSGTTGRARPKSVPGAASASSRASRCANRATRF